MSGVSNPVDKTASSNIQHRILKRVSENIIFEKVKKIAIPILIIVGILLADIGAAFFNVSMPVLGSMIVASAISIVAMAILKIKEQSELKKIHKKNDKKNSKTLR